MIIVMQVPWVIYDNILLIIMIGMITGYSLMIDSIWAMAVRMNHF